MKLRQPIEEMPGWRNPFLRKESVGSIPTPGTSKRRPVSDEDI